MPDTTQLPSTATYDEVIALGFIEWSADFDLCHPEIKTHRYAYPLIIGENSKGTIDMNGKLTLIDLREESRRQEP